MDPRGRPFAGTYSEKMNPKQFLQIGGAVLVLVGILGFLGPIGPDQAASVFGKAWWFDNGENWAHLLLGVAALVALFVLPAGAQRGLVMLVGVLALFFAVYNLFSTNFLGANLERPADLLLHLVIGLWALKASKNKGGASMKMGM